MTIRRGEVWWADLDEPVGSEPGFSRPVVIVQNDEWNRSQLSTVIVAPVTSNQRLGDLRGNVRLAAGGAGLDRPSVVNMTQIAAINRDRLVRKMGELDELTVDLIDWGLGFALGISDPDA